MFCLKVKVPGVISLSSANVAVQVRGWHDKPNTPRLLTDIPFFSLPNTAILVFVVVVISKHQDAHIFCINSNESDLLPNSLRWVEPWYVGALHIATSEKQK